MKKHGFGRYIWNDGEYFIGTWKDDERCKGVMYFNNGNKYEGEFLGDKSNVRGKYTHANGRIIEGLWINGIF